MVVTPQFVGLSLMFDARRQLGTGEVSIGLWVKFSSSLSSFGVGEIVKSFIMIGDT